MDFVEHSMNTDWKTNIVNLWKKKKKKLDPQSEGQIYDKLFLKLPKHIFNILQEARMIGGWQKKA